MHGILILRFYTCKKKIYCLRLFTDLVDVVLIDVANVRGLG